MHVPVRRTRLVIGLAACVVAAPAMAAAQSAKASAQVANLHVLASTTAAPVTTPWQTILASSIRTSQQKDLFVGVSLESSLLTRGLTRSRNRIGDKTSASAGVEVQVLVDGRAAHPGSVVFNKRRQELTATFQGILAGCLSVDALTGGVVLDEACVEPEELELLLDTTSANHFDFVLDDVGVGTHRIEVQARIDVSASFTGGSGRAQAVIGKGSVTVEEVRLVKGATVFEP